MDIKCKVHEVLPTQKVTDTFSKRELIVEYAENPQYPEYIKFEALQDKCGLFDSLKVGDNVEVFFNLRGRPWTDKAGKTNYFNTLVVWRVNVLEEGAEPVQTPVSIANEADDSDDLPF